jgi:hypothetical protein
MKLEIVVAIDPSAAFDDLLRRPLRWQVFGLHSY